MAGCERERDEGNHGWQGCHEDLEVAGRLADELEFWLMRGDPKTQREQLNPDGHNEKLFKAMTSLRSLMYVYRTNKTTVW